MKLLDTLKKKGAKINIFKIPTQATPFDISHSIHTEFQRGKVIRVLNRVHEFLDGIEASGTYHEPDHLQYLTAEIAALLRELKSYKK